MFCGMRLFMLLCIIGLALLTYLLTYLLKLVVVISGSGVCEGGGGGLLIF